MIVQTNTERPAKRLIFGHDRVWRIPFGEFIAELPAADRDTPGFSKFWAGKFRELRNTRWRLHIKVIDQYGTRYYFRRLA